MSHSDTGETPCFKIKYIETVTNVESITNNGDNGLDTTIIQPQ